MARKKKKTSYFFFSAFGARDAAFWYAQSQKNVAAGITKEEERGGVDQVARSSAFLPLNNVSFVDGASDALQILSSLCLLLLYIANCYMLLSTDKCSGKNQLFFFFFFSLRLSAF